MFTGLIEGTGVIVSIAPEGRGRRLVLRSAIPVQELSLGDSIAVQGACLTVDRIADGAFELVAGKETLDRTTLGSLHVGTKVHLERALRVGDRLGGHWVQGHVDGVGWVASLTVSEESSILWMELPPELARYVAAKGSVAVDGVSLTVNEVVDRRFRVNIIPRTSETCLFGRLHPGDPVNLEVDVIAKYIERLLAFRDTR